MVGHIVNLDFNYPVVVFVFIFLLCSLAMLSLYLLWKSFVFALKCFVDSRMSELNKQKDRLWLAVEDLYEATDDLKERTWDYDDNRKQVKNMINKQHFSYKGYTGSIDFSMEDMCLFGKVQMIQDLIMYDGETLEELKLSFESAVDEYLEMCA